MDKLTKLESTLLGILYKIQTITEQTHVDSPTRERPYTALSQIDALARSATTHLFK